jgi:tRNA threonylcarbamoyladenosine biosynthesis protein TsaB
VKYLTIDTTTKVTALALAEIRPTGQETGGAGDGDPVRVVGEGFLHDDKTRSEQLIPFLETLLSAAGWAPKDLAGIIAVRGPGSFTGIRIGLATAQGLAKVLCLPVWGVLSLDCLSWATAHMAWGGEKTPLTAVILDARKQEWYAACYHWGPPGNRRCLMAPCAARPENFLRQLHELSGAGGDSSGEPPRPVIFAGDALLHEDTRQLIRDHLGQGAVILPPEQALPRGSYVAREGVYARQWNTHMETAPYYIRLSEAESKYLQAQKVL